MRKSTYAVLPLLASCVMVGGCGDTTFEPAVVPQVAPNTPVGINAQRAPDHFVPGQSEMVLPIEAYLFSDAENDRYLQARWILIQGCMQERGYTVPSSPARSSVASVSSRIDRRYGAIDSSTAAERGYHIASELAYRGASDLVPPWTPEFDAAMQTCSDSAYEELSGSSVDIAGISDLAERIDNESWTMSRADPRVIDVFGAWSTCMNESGYAFDDPIAAGSAPEFAIGDATEAEILTALADVACKERTDLVNVWYEVEAEYQDGLISENAAALAEIRADMLSQLGRADRIIDGS